MVSFSAKINSLSVPTTGGRTIAALSGPENWSLDNVKLFGDVLLQYGEELDLLEMERELHEKEVRDVQNRLVKGSHALRYSVIRFRSDTLRSGYEERGGLKDHEGEE